LEAGWNAVFLEVAPVDSVPATVFADTPIDIAASHYGSPSSAQFMTNPDADMLRETGWAAWYAPSRDDSFLTSLLRFTVSGLTSCTRCPITRGW
jgi:hypothetical protein